MIIVCLACWLLVGSGVGPGAQCVSGRFTLSTNWAPLQYGPNLSLNLVSQCLTFCTIGKMGIWMEVMWWHFLRKLISSHWYIYLLLFFELVARVGQWPSSTIAMGSCQIFDSKAILEYILSVSHFTLHFDIIQYTCSSCYTGLSCNVYVVLSPYDSIVLVGLASILP